MVLLCGASGFIGSKIKESLHANKIDVVSLERKMDPLKSANTVIGDIVNLDYSDVQNQLGQKKIDTIIYSIGLIRQTKYVTFADLHITGVEHAVSLGKKIGISKFILISANGVKDELDKNNTEYLKTKFLGEQIVKQSGISYTILRPSVVWDEDNQYNFKSVLTNLVSKRVVPVFGFGNYKLAPVHRIDIAEVITKLASQPILPNKIYHVCGPQEFTYQELLQKVATEKSKSIIIIPIPVFIMRMMAGLLGNFSWFPVTNDQITMLLDGNISEDHKIWEDFGMRPRKI